MTVDPDPYGRAIRDFHRGRQDEPLLVRDGTDTSEHPLERFYFTDVASEDHEDEDLEWLETTLRGPLLGMGAGAGRHALHFQEVFETTAIDVSDHLVATMRERGVADARKADMFALREAFDRDRFGSAFAHGTQLGLAGSMGGLRQFLGDLAFVTTPEATAVLDCYDPTDGRTSELVGYRPDPTPGLAYRTFHFEYEGDVGETLLFRLFSPDRLGEAATGTGWIVVDVRRGSGENSHYYRIVLAKE